MSAIVHYVRSLWYKHQKDFAEFYKSSLLYLAFISSDSLPADQKLVGPYLQVYAQRAYNITWNDQLVENGGDFASLHAWEYTAAALMSKQACCRCS